MKVSYNPLLSFKSDTNLIAAKMNNIQLPQAIPTSDSFSKSYEVNSPHSLESEENRKNRIITEQENLIKITTALQEGENLDGILRGSSWEKKYDELTNTVHLKIPNSYDGTEYTIKSDGTVIKENGWSNPEVLMKSNKEMSDYVKSMKDGKIDEYFAKLDNPPKKANGNYGVTEKSKDELFKNALASRKWNKEYLPENNIIVLHEKGVNDGLEYLMEKDGTVKEIGTRIKPTVIIEPSIDGAKQFGKLKSKLSSNSDLQDKSLWYKMKYGISKFWKFLSVTGTMTAAIAKGIFDGTVAAAGVLASTILVRGTVSLINKNAKYTDIIKKPLKTAGKTGAILSTLAGGTALAYNIVKGKFKANQNSAVIEHKMDVSHVNG